MSSKHANAFTTAIIAHNVPATSEKRHKFDPDEPFVNLSAVYAIAKSFLDAPNQSLEDQMYISSIVSFIEEFAKKTGDDLNAPPIRVTRKFLRRHAKKSKCEVFPGLATYKL